MVSDTLSRMKESRCKSRASHSCYILGLTSDYCRVAAPRQNTFKPGGSLTRCSRTFTRSSGSLFKTGKTTIRPPVRRMSTILGPCEIPRRTRRSKSAHMKDKTMWRIRCVCPGDCHLFTMKLVLTLRHLLVSGFGFYDAGIDAVNTHRSRKHAVGMCSGFISLYASVFQLTYRHS